MRLWIDITIALLIVAGAAVWGARYWRHATATGVPFFYQPYFEPAVMIACGKGFVGAEPPIPAVTAFLAQQQDRLSCDVIPPNAVFSQRGLFQAAWRYLLLTVGLTWRVLGISWTGLGPLAGLLFGITMGAIYAICRLGMGPILASLCTIGLCVSRLQLTYLPVVRDFAKAPFTLLLVFILGLLVALRPTKARVLSLALAYGVVLGFGYGFRTDLLASIPPLLVTLFLFLPGRPWSNLRLKTAAAVVSIAAFTVTSAPVISAVARIGGCQWHTVLLGFPLGFSRPLGLVDGPYRLMPVYSDNVVYATVTSYMARQNPGIGGIGYCSPAYDAATGRYLVALARQFPADMIIRGYGAVLRVVELPFSWNRTPDWLFDVQHPDPLGSHHYGLMIVGAAVVLALLGSVRIGVFLIVFVLYFGGYPALQFHARHYFHLEFITWWAAGFVLHSLLVDARPSIREWRLRGGFVRASLQAATLLTAVAVLLSGTLYVARTHQQAATLRLFNGYLAVRKDVVPLAEARMPVEVPRTAPGTNPETADFLEIDVNRWRCDPKSAITLRYNPAVRRDFSRRFLVAPDNAAEEPTRIFSPLYDHFSGIEMADVPAGCVSGVYRAHNPADVGLMLEVVLPPQWATKPLYQRFGEPGPPELDAVP